MEIQGNEYRVAWDPAAARVTCVGILDLRGKEGYLEIMGLLDTLAEEDLPLITLDFTGLEFLNSSGITVLGSFIIKVRNRGKTSLRLVCASRHTWQPRSMQGLQKLMPGISMEVR